jgi:hypothetical protein
MNNLSNPIVWGIVSIAGAATLIGIITLADNIYHRDSDEDKLLLQQSRNGGKKYKKNRTRKR